MSPVARLLMLPILASPWVVPWIAPAHAQDVPLGAQTLVRTLVAKRQAVPADIVFTGDIQAQAQTNVSFRSAGKIAERLFEVGDHIKADQVLARLDPQE